MLARKIWKFPLSVVANRQTIIGPRLSRPFSVGFDSEGGLCLWGVVTPEERFHDQQWEWEVLLVKTGEVLPEGATTENYVARVPQINPFGTHVYVKRVQPQK